jgi:hypothetical protein
MMNTVVRFLLLTAWVIPFERCDAQSDSLPPFSRFVTHFPVERVFLHCDKYAVLPGDTLWWKAYEFVDGRAGGFSTNLYVQLFSEDGRLRRQGLFPVVRGVSFGQFSLPDSLPAGVYWLRAFTRYQLNFDTTNLFTVPITVMGFRARSGNPGKVYMGTSSPIASERGGILMIASRSDSGLVCHIERDSLARWVGRPLDLVLTASGTPLVRARFRLSDSRDWQDLLLRTTDVVGRGDLLLFCGDSLLCRQSVELGGMPSTPAVWLGDTVSALPGGLNVWRVQIKDLHDYNCSVSVTDADVVPAEGTGLPEFLEGSVGASAAAQEVRYADTTFLTWNGLVTTERGKSLSGRELIVMLDRDTMRRVRPVLEPIGAAGRVEIKGAFFFDSAYMSYQLNGLQDDPRDRAIRVTFDGFRSPVFRVPAEGWRDTVWKRPSNVLPPEDTSIPAGFKAKELPAVVVKAQALKELDDRYAKGIFTEPTQFVFDLREDKTVSTVWRYLRKNLPGFHGGSDIGLPPGLDDRETIFYVDGEPRSIWEVDNFWYEEMAYVKAYTSLMVDETAYMKAVTGYDGFKLEPLKAGLSVPVGRDPAVICIYTRKGNDIRSAWKGLPRWKVAGYTPSFAWFPQAASNATLYWSPIQTGNHFTIRFYNHHAQRFRLTIEGVSPEGKVVHFETIIDVPNVAKTVSLLQGMSVD